MDPEILAYIEPYERRREGGWVYYSAPPSFVPVACSWSSKAWECVVEVKRGFTWYPVYRVFARTHFVHVDGTRRSALAPAKPRPYEVIERTVFKFAVRRRSSGPEFDGRGTVEFRVKESDL